MILKKSSIFPCLWLLAIVVFDQCNDRPRDLGSYQAWFNNPDNGFVKEKQIGYIRYRVYYRPVELMMLNDLDRNRSYTKTALDSIKATYGNSLYFMLEMAYADESVSGDMLRHHYADYESYAQKVKELSFNIQPYINLAYDSDTVLPSLHHFERGYELGKRQRFLFAFPAPPKDISHFTFTYLDDLFKAGKLNFRFDAAIREQVPELPLLP